MDAVSGSVISGVRMDWEDGNARVSEDDLAVLFTELQAELGDMISGFLVRVGPNSKRTGFTLSDAHGQFVIDCGFSFKRRRMFALVSAFLAIRRGALVRRILLDRRTVEYGSIQEDDAIHADIELDRLFEALKAAVRVLAAEAYIQSHLAIAANVGDA